MNKTVKKLLSSALSLALAAGSIVLPTAAGAAEYTPLVAGDTVLNEWKFDFGAADSTPEDGYTLVTPDKNFVTAKDYGFLGIDDQSYKLGDRLDSFGSQKGQVIQLQAGGGTGLYDAIGSVGEDSFGNSGEKFYPTRFALAVEDDTYYRVKATVTTLDPAKDATVSLYTERKHPIFTQKKITAGETYTAEFSLRVTPIYYEKSEPKGQIADKMVNVAVLGENSALASLEIQQVETLPTFWVLGDSTVTDGNCALPFWPLQNYTGVGTGLTKYLPTNYAMVNEGEGGLNAADSYHFNMVSSRIKEGDYLYVEYGHNHKSDGPTGYVSCLDKYYNLCHSKGAKLLIVSPIERINVFSNGAYQHSLDGFATAGKEYVAGKVAAGATDIAYVELNKYSLDFYNKIVTDNGGDANAIKYYFQTAKGGGTDTTHPNDAGAENLAYEFFKAAKTVTDAAQKAVLAPIIDNMKDETPNLVSADVMAGGVGGASWPVYVVPTDNKYPVVINNIEFDENGAAIKADVTVQDAVTPLATYGIIVITILDENGNEKGKIYAKDQVDNSTGKGPQTIVNFTNDVTLGENDTYTAIVLQADDTSEGLKVTENGTVYSAEYIPTDIVKLLLTNEDKDGIENFDYYGAEYDGTSTLDKFNGWSNRGSAGKNLTLGESGDLKYATIGSDGAKNGAANQGSFCVAKNFDEEIGSSGRYVVSADMKFVSGGGLVPRFVVGNSDSNAWGTGSIDLFTVGANGAVTIGGKDAGTISAIDFTNVQYILDMDLGTATISVGGDDPVTIDVPNYATTSTQITPEKFTGFMFGGDKIAFEVQVANLTVAQLKAQKLPEYDFSVVSKNKLRGTVSFSTPTPEPTPEPEATTESAQLASDDEGAPSVTLNYIDGNATVSSTAAVNAVLTEASYNESGALKSVKTHIVTIAEEGGSQSVKVAEGTKLMLWDSFDNVKPLLEAVSAVTPLDSQIESGKFALNTIITAKAAPNAGYAFMGWYNDNNELVSMDAEYVFRLRDNLTLTANLVPEPTLADIKTFEVSAESLNIKVSDGASTTMIISDAKDANGTPMTKVTNADMTWSCSEPGVTVSADGVVTFGADFSMGDALTKEVAISASINGITKSCTITVFAYEYFENMTEGSTKFDGLFMTIAGKTAIVFPGASTTKKYTMGNAVTLDKTTTVKFDNVWSGSNTCGQTRTLNFKNSAGATIFSMYYSWGSLKVGDVELAGAVSKDVYSTITVEINPETNVVTVTAGDNTATTTLADGAGDLAGIDFVSASSVPGPDARALGICNIVISK